MKTEVLQEKLSLALSHITKAVSNKPNIPVLSNVLIKTEKGKIKLASTNLEIGITATIGADVEEEGETTVSAKLLFEFINSIKPGKITLQIEENKLVVNSVDNNAQFNVISADEFPTMPEANDASVLTMKALDFAEAIEKTAFCASNDAARPVLTGILTKITEHKISFVAVDGFRLAQKIIDIDTSPTEEFKEIIPAKALLDLSKIIKDTSNSKDKISIHLLREKNQVIFKLSDIEFASRLIEGEFPAYEDIIPKDRQYGCSLLKSEFIDAVKIVSIFARNVTGNKCKFKIDAENKKLKLSCVAADLGSNEVGIDVGMLTGNDIETAYNARFLADITNAIHSDEIIYETNGVTAPGVFRDSKDDKYLLVIMPMRVE